MPTPVNAGARSWIGCDLIRSLTALFWLESGAGMFLRRLRPFTASAERAVLAGTIQNSFPRPAADLFSSSRGPSSSMTSGSLVSGFVGRPLMAAGFTYQVNLRICRGLASVSDGGGCGYRTQLIICPMSCKGLGPRAEIRGRLFDLWTEFRCPRRHAAAGSPSGVPHRCRAYPVTGRCCP